jgi:hypothetical protein
MHEAAVGALMGILLYRTLAPRRPRADQPSLAPVVAVQLAARADDSGNMVLDIRMAVAVNGTAMVQTTVVPAPTLTVSALANAVTQLLGQVGIAVPSKRGLGRVFLIAMDGKSVLSHVADVTRDARIRQMGADIHHADFAPVTVGTARLAISLLDFSAFFLDYDTEEIATFIGFGSVDTITAQNAGTLGHEAASQFAAEGRQVSVIALAFSQFRDRLMARWGVDPLRNRTLASLAGRIFMGHFAKTGPARWKKAKTVKKRRTASGFRDERRNEKVFAGNPEVRLAAARSLWGGAMIAFVRGLVVQPLVELDAVSLYPHAALAQPLPHHRTRWRSLRSLDELGAVEGFVKVEFEFPLSFSYPNLPTVRDGISRLVFTRRGISCCTIAELRVALRLGATVRVLDSHVFEPGRREREHDVAAYMRQLLAEKAAARKRTIPYETAKLLANSLIGKLAERFGGSSLLDFERSAQLQGFAAGLGSAVASSGAFHQALKRTTDAGAMFAPEWAALSIGRGRAVMGDICAAGRALLISTDAVLVGPNADLSSPGLAELRRVGSDMRLEHAADGAFIARNRSYVLLKRPQNVTADDTVFAADSEWAVIRTARHGSSETPVEFAETVLACLAAKSDVAPQRVRRRRVGAHEAVREGKGINEEISEPHRTTFKWDWKRRLMDRDLNPFSGNTPTEPYDTVGAMESAERQTSKARRRTERRTSQQEARRLRAVLRLLADGLSVEEVAHETGVPTTTVTEILEHMPAGESGEDQGD